MIYEFWVVSTRPRENRGFGWTTYRAGQAVDRLIATFDMEMDTPDVFETWRGLVEEKSIKGKRAHDARLAAFKEANEILYLITLNVDDFAGLTEGVLAPDAAKETAP